MKLFFRLIWLILTQSRRSRCHMLTPCETHFRVLPNDLDIFFHMNNGVYLTLMDLARTDLLLRADAFYRIKRKGWYPVIAAESIRFRRSLRLGEKFTITTRVLGWDDKSIYLDQVFSSKGKPIAHAIVDARFLARKGGKIMPEQLLTALEIPDPSPVLPEWISHWQQSLSGLEGRN